MRRGGWGVQGEESGGGGDEWWGDFALEKGGSAGFVNRKVCVCHDGLVY